MGGVEKYWGRDFGAIIGYGERLILESNYWESMAPPVHSYHASMAARRSASECSHFQTRPSYVSLP